jgi:hypothetical protein
MDFRGGRGDTQGKPGGVARETLYDVGYDNEEI